MYDGQLPSLGLMHVSILCVMANLVLGWGLLLASHVLASRAAGSDERSGEAQRTALSG